MKETNLYMSKVGFVNGMSIVSKAFITGDFILSQGQMQFYAKEDMVLSRIETQIKDTNFGSPSTLGVNSTVIYSITNYNPKPETQPVTVEETQALDYQILDLMQQNTPVGSKGNSLTDLHSDLYKLGMLELNPSANMNVVAALRNQIQYHDVPNMTAEQRMEFLGTEEGQILLRNAQDVNTMHVNATRLNALQDEQDAAAAPSPHLDAITRQANAELQRSFQNIAERTPARYTPQTEELRAEIDQRAAEREGLRLEDLAQSEFERGILTGDKDDSDGDEGMDAGSPPPPPLTAEGREIQDILGGFMTRARQRGDEGLERDPLNIGESRQNRRWIVGPEEGIRQEREPTPSPPPV